MNALNNTELLVRKLSGDFAFHSWKERTGCCFKHLYEHIRSARDFPSESEIFIPNPRRSGIYFLLKHEIVVYVGMSTMLFGRLPAHLRHKDFDSVLMLEYPAHKLRAAENYWIKTLRPVLNDAPATFQVNPKRIDRAWRPPRYPWKCGASRIYKCKNGKYRQFRVSFHEDARRRFRTFTSEQQAVNFAVSRQNVPNNFA